MFSQKNLFVLEVPGDSMIEDQIADGDYVVVRKQRTARDGQIVVALTDEGEATLKRWFPEKNRIRLEPANSIDEADLRQERQGSGRGGRRGAQGRIRQDRRMQQACRAYAVSCNPKRLRMRPTSSATT